MDAKSLLAAWGTSDPDAVAEKKIDKAQTGGVVCRASKPKVTKVRLKPDECKALCKGIGLEYLEGYEERVLQYCLTDETVDRYGDVVKAAGCDMKNYMQQPVVLAFHNGHSFPVGNIIKIWHDEAKAAIMGWVLFFDDRLERSPEQIAETAFRYASSGAMKAGSIGFNSITPPRRPDEEERKSLRMPPYGVIYDKWEMMEFSVTPIPANPNATQRDMEIFTREGVEAARESAIIDACDIDAMLDIIADIQKDATQAPAPATPEALPPVALEQTVTHEHSVKLDIGVSEESIKMFINRMSLLCDRLGVVANALEAVATVRTAEPCGAHQPAPRNAEPDSSDIIKGLVDMASASIAKYRSAS